MRKKAKKEGYVRQIIQEVQPKEESKEIPRIMVKREPRILAIHNFRTKPNQNIVRFLEIFLQEERWKPE